ncbi:MAG: hypothetical protein N2110_01325 [Flavobacteriales bacterium]|nr:hypothetical protein [Flavobacteriales bacterium]MCX7767651.1 hypothetical protein [Flavobacteriales bacterium]MDW8409507.1 hypothetical protein [Flavobacteriales bacterium]
MQVFLKNFLILSVSFWVSGLRGQPVGWRLRWPLPSPELQENSGMVLIQGNLLFINDSKNEARVFITDTLMGKLKFSCAIRKAVNVDWEDLAADADYLYIGDFGNNSGTRSHMAILRIPLSCLFSKPACNAEFIYFECEDQREFHWRPQQHNFDFEALCVVGDSLLLFSKNWRDHNTRAYVLPKNPGHYKLRPRATLPVGGLITAADYLPSQKILALCGYQPHGNSLEPFLILWKNFSLKALTTPSFKKIPLPQASQLQTEGLVCLAPHRFWISHEQDKRRNSSQPSLYEITLL